MGLVLSFIGSVFLLAYLVRRSTCYSLPTPCKGTSRVPSLLALLILGDLTLVLQRGTGATVPHIGIASEPESQNNMYLKFKSFPCIPLMVTGPNLLLVLLATNRHW